MYLLNRKVQIHLCKENNEVLKILALRTIIAYCFKIATFALKFSLKDKWRLGMSLSKFLIKLYLTDSVFSITKKACQSNWNEEMEEKPRDGCINNGHDKYYSYLRKIFVLQNNTTSQLKNCSREWWIWKSNEPLHLSQCQKIVMSSRSYQMKRVRW